MRFRVTHDTQEIMYIKIWFDCESGSFQTPDFYSVTLKHNETFFPGLKIKIKHSKKYQIMFRG